MERDADDPTPVDDSVEILDVPPKRYDKLRGDWYKIPPRVYACAISRYLPISVKNRLYRDMGVDVGEETVIAIGAVVDPFFPEKLSIGDRSLVGWGTKLLTHEAYTDEWHVGPVEIGDDVTFGHSCSTRPGVTIGDGATVAAHSFVNRDVEPGETVGGSPIEPL